LDTDESLGEAQALVGPLKLKRLIRATVVALAVASGWQVVMPHGARPGNLARAFGENNHTGHACAADFIGGEMMAIGAAKFMWRTHFVVLPMVHRPSEFSILTDTSLMSAEEKVPRLTDVDQQTNILLTVDESFIRAVGSSPESLAELLLKTEDFHYKRLNRAIERAEG
jgi:hypothetical protein